MSVKRPPVEQIRRLALAAALVVVLILAGSYGWRRWQAYRARAAVPATMPADVQQQTEEFSFSGSEGGRTVFTVHASRTVERAGRTVMLENVVVTVFGRRGERADEIRTGRCEYDLGGTGRIRCPGAVTIRLGANQPASIELSTAAVEFDTAKGEAWTDEPVEFSFPDGTGSAVGLRYTPEEPRARLEKQVVIRVRRTGAAAEIRGAELQYFAGAQTFELVAPLEVRTDDRSLTAEHLRMELGEGYRTRRVEAVGNVRMRASQAGGLMELRAARAVADYGDSGRLRELRAAGGVRLERRAAASEDELDCDEAVFSFDATGQWIERSVARGNPRLVSRAAGQTRELRAPVLELTLRPGGGGPERLAAAERGTLLLRRMNGEEFSVTADHLQLDFGAGLRLEHLAASGNVQTSDMRAGGAARTTSSDELRARFDAEGRMAEAEQRGHFRYQDERRRAGAGRADYNAASQTYTLREQPVVWDSSSRTSARVIAVHESSGVLEAEGDVRSTRQPAADSAGFGGGQPVQLAAERLRAENERGWARYEGQARLWQGENRLAAQAIELFRAPGRLVAEGSVSGLFLERRAASDAAANAERRAVQINSGRFTYLEAERRGVFEEGVVARNSFGTLAAPRLEVFLVAGTDRLERAHASGGVELQQGARRASGEQAEYRSAEQTVVLWGGAPRLTDPERGTTTGDRLTLFLSDGTISIDSAERTRTVTRPATAQ